MKDKIISANGSIQDIAEIPADIKELYKTVWEIKMRNIIDMAADRGAYICQSQSLNLFINSPNASKLTSMHFTHGRKALKQVCITCVHKQHRKRLNLLLKTRAAKTWIRLSRKC
jgi:ribonucleotide reductase alpha subunit